MDIIGLMGAMEDEIAPLAACMVAKESTSLGGIRFTSGLLGGTLVYHDGEPRMFAETYPHQQEFHSDARLLAAAASACEVAGVKHIVGKIATGDRFVGDKATKEAIAAKCAPECVEMEGAAVAHIAAKNDVPFVILRAMSDNADESAYETLVVKQFDVGEYCRTAAKISAALIAAL